MVQLSIALQAHLRRLGVVDLSLCSACVARLEASAAAEVARQRAEAQAAAMARGQRTWSSLAPDRAATGSSTGLSSRMGASPSAMGRGGSDSLATTAQLGSTTVTPAAVHDSLRSLHGSLALLELSPVEAERVLGSTAFGQTVGGLPRDVRCTVCRGTGNDAMARFGYTEEDEVHALVTPGMGDAPPSSSSAGQHGAVAGAGADGTDVPVPSIVAQAAAFSPEALAVRAQLMREHSLSGLLRRKEDARMAAKVNSMHSGLEVSRTLIRKSAPASGPIVDVPTELPVRDKKWLLQQFKELKFAPPARTTAEKRISAELPAVDELDQDLMLCTNLTSLSLAAHQVETLENLPASIRVLHLYGNKISKIRVKRPPSESGTEGGQAASTTSLRAAAKDGVTSPKAVTSTAAKSRTAKASSPVRKPVVLNYYPSAPPPPRPVLPNSAYPYLRHLGLAFNKLDNFSLLLPLAASIESLDLGWNSLCSLGEVLDGLSAFPRLKKLTLEGNPLALTRVYRASVLSVFRELARTQARLEGKEVGAEYATTLDTLDGFPAVPQVEGGQRQGHAYSGSIGGGVLLSGAGGGSNGATPAPGDDHAASSSRSGSFSAHPAPGSASPSARAMNSSDGNGNGSSAGTPVSSGRKASGNGTAGLPGAGKDNSAQPPAPAAAAATKSLKKGKKPTAAEIEAEAVAARALARAQAEAERQAAEDLLQREALEFVPSPEAVHEPATLLVSLQGFVKGLANPREAFDRAHQPKVEVEEGKGKGGKGKAAAGKAGSKSSMPGTPNTEAPSSPRSSTAAGGSHKKKSSKAALVEEPLPDDPDKGWFVSVTRSESHVGAGAGGAQGATVASAGASAAASTAASPAPIDLPPSQVTSKVRMQVRYYVEYRLLPNEASAEDGNFQAQVDATNVDAQDGSVSGGPGTTGEHANVTGKVNLGNGQGNQKELFRTVEYSWEELSLPAAIPLAVAPALKGSPSSEHQDGMAYAKEVRFGPSVAWRDLIAHSGLQLLLYRVERTERSVETRTPVAPKPGSPGELATRASTPGSPGQGKKGLSSGKSKSGDASAAGSAASAKKKSSASSSGSKKNSAPELPPLEWTTSTTSDSSETHTLLGLASMDLSSFLSISATPGQQPKMLGTSTLRREELTFRRAPGQAVEAPRGLAPGEVDPRAWNPQTERRLLVEVSGEAERATKGAVDLARDEGTRVALAALVEPPPLRKAHQEEKDNSAAPPAAAPVSARGSSRSGRPTAAQEREAAAQLAAAQAAAAAAAQERDPEYVLGSATVCWNSRPAAGPGSNGWKQPPSPEALAAAAAAAAALAEKDKGKKGRKSPGPTNAAKIAASAAEKRPASPKAEV